jgi:hypothetical protein
MRESRCSAPDANAKMTENNPLGRRQRGAFATRLVAILVCGGIGGVAGWSIVSLLRWDGAFGAFVAALIAMVISMMLWAGGILALRSLERRR